MMLDLTRSLAEIVLPAFGVLAVDAIAALYQLCEGVNEFKAVCQALLQRYEKLWDSMKTLETENLLPKSTVVPQFSDSLGGFKLFLDNYQNKNWLNRLAGYRGVMDRIADFNNDIDDMLRVLNIDFMAESLQRQSDMALMQQDILALLQKMANDRQLIGSTVRDGGAGSLKEPLMLLKYESRKHGDESHVALVESTFHKVMTMARVDLPAIEEWFVSPDDINYKLERLDDGSFGKVSRGTFMKVPVVIKFVLMDTEQERVQFFKEAGIWHQICKKNPYILRLLGVCHVTSPGMFLCEDATNGNFAEYFADGKNRHSMWKLFYEASLGMLHLQSMRIVHGNLKCNNLLVGPDGTARVSDFGFAFQRSAARKLSKKIQSEELKWKAPECIRGDGDGNPILKSDVYSFGMCIIEAHTGKVPFDGFPDETITDAAFDNVPVCCPVGMSECVWALVEKMTRSDPADRVDMKYVNAELEKLADDEAKNVEPPCSNCSKPMSVIDKFCSGCGAPRISTARPQNGLVTELGENLELLASKCESTFENQLLCLHVTDRLREVWKQLRKINEDQDDGLEVDEDVVLKALDLVATYRGFVEELLVKRENVVEQLIMEREVLAKLETYHVQIDLLVVRLSMGQVDTWRQQWIQHHEMLAKGLCSRLTSSGSILEQVSDCAYTLRQLDTEIGRCPDQMHLPALKLARGTILEFLNSKCTVTVTVVKATDLAAADYNGLSDPYVKLRVGKETFTSKRVKKNLNPVWPDNAFKFIVRRKNPENLNVEVWDKDFWTSDDHIGTLCVPLSPFVTGTHSSVQEMAYLLTVPEEYVSQKRQSKLFLKIAVDTSSVVA